MPAVLDGEPCPSCGGAHTLCLDGHEPTARRWDYEYTCPVTGKAVRFRTVAWGRIESRCPQLALRAWPADPPGEQWV